MLTTPQLRSQFEASFSRIVRSVSADLQKKWGGAIAWKDDRSYPEIHPDIIGQLTPGAKAAYVTLLNKLSRGRL